MEQSPNTNQTNDVQPEHKNPDVLYVDINPDAPVTEIESLCMSCHEKGTTRILMTKIPFFKDIIIMSFSCPHCGFRSNEVEPGEALSDHGINFKLTVQTSKDLNRRVIKSNFATIKVPCCGLEIPPNTQKGKLTTVEGFLSTTRDQFTQSMNDGLYSQMGDEFNAKIKELIQNLNDALDGKKYPFEFTLDDPSGNSFIENPYAPQSDPGIKVEYYERTKEMTESMGYSYENQKEELGKKEDKKVEEDKKETTSENKEKKDFVAPTYYDKKKDFTVYKSNSSISNHIIDFTKSIENKEDSIKEESLAFPTNCYCCQAPGEMHTCLCTIPYFKEIIISCFKCDQCGYKTTEVKGGGGISEKGAKITLTVKNEEDLNRDVFKSETSKIVIPEIGFETSDGSMGSMYTTVEGVIDKLCENLANTPFSAGDSKVDNSIDLFVQKLKGLKELKQEFTLILDDPLANCFVFPVGDPEKDTRLKKEEYERTFEQNEELGINDMKVDNY